MVLLISYDLRGRERPSSYARVKSYIEDHAQDSIRPLYSQWLVETSSDAHAWTDALRAARLLDVDDRLLICPVRSASDCQGWLAESDWAWLQARA